MNTHRTLPLVTAMALSCTLLAGNALAKPEPEACIALGALAYDDWTSLDGGGSGLPAGEANVEYLRCVSCHGWDRLGELGGFVRRERNADQPNTGLGDSNAESRVISPGLGNYRDIGPWGVLHEGRGRAYEDGSGSWVELGEDPTPEELAAHAAGYTLGNLHPDFSTTGVNGDDVVLTQDQVDCLVDFVNYGNADPQFYFQDVIEEENPVRYVINSGASATAGETYYDENCRRCHGEPGDDHDGMNDGQPEGGIAAFLRTDGAYSEFAHKARWGIPDTAMTREAIGSPDSQDTIDLMLYLQEYNQDLPVFLITNAISGTWWQSDRNGEGFMLDVAPEEGGGWRVVASYYTYDGFGNQVWLSGTALAEGSEAFLPMEMTAGGLFGLDFDKTLVERYDWGTLEFQFTSCHTGHAWLTPSEDMLQTGMGFEAVDFDITRFTPTDACP